jgi:hypothetical protein
LPYEPLLRENLDDDYSNAKQQFIMKEKKQDLIQKLRKKENYGKYVKEMYWPKISDKKKHELHQMMDKIKHKSPALARKSLDKSP